MNDPLNADERWFAHLLATIPAPDTLDSWTPSVTAPVLRPGRRRQARVRPLAVALAIAVLVGVVGASLGLVLPRHGGGNPATPATALIPGIPQGRTWPAMAADPAARRVLLFGGRGGAGLLEDTWSWDGHRWSRLVVPTGSPPARTAAGMAADPGGGVLLFGGTGALGPLGDTWRWDGQAWSLLHPVDMPPPSSATLMAPDPAGGGDLLAAAAPVASGQVSTWRWAGGDWHRLPTAAAPPSCGSAMAADPAGRRVLLVTGSTCPAPLAGATWSWDGHGWTELRPAGAPPAQDHPVLGTGGGRLALLPGGPGAGHGCAARTTWTWDGAAWSAHTPPASPPAAAAGATDPATGDLLVVTPAGETWRWDGSTWRLGEAGTPQSAAPAGPWSERSPTACPPPRTGAAVATDEARHQVVLFGGSASPQDRVPPVLGDTWVWDGSTWSQRHPNPAPPARTDAVAAWDAAHGVVVLFGGEGLDDKGAPAAFNATWTWDGSAWKRRAPSSAPPGQHLTSMAWDPGGRTVLLVTATSQQAAETWSWNGSEWTKLHPHATPPFGSLVTAPELGGLLLVSQAGQPSTWSYSGGDWHRLAVTGTPALRGGAVAHDAATHRVLLVAAGETWTFDGRAWSELPTATAPVTRSGVALAADPGGGVLLFGGAGPVALLGDTWEFG